MGKRSAAALTAGSANAAKLFVAALAVTGAYLGVSAYDTASSAQQPVRTINLQAREVPITSETPAPAPGTISVTALAGTVGCDRTYLARTVLINPDPGTTLMYRWRLARWSPRTKTWTTYLVDHSGFGGTRRTVEWEPRIPDNPGWYRVELSVKDSKTIKSDRFQASC